MRVASTLGFVLLVLGARPAWPCLYPLPGLDDADFPFEQRTVPANGVLRGYGFTGEVLVRFVNDFSQATVTGMSERDGRSFVLVPETPLSPGQWRVIVEPVDPLTEDTSREIAFTVGVDDDVDPPAPPIATATNQLRGSLVAWTSCDEAPNDVIVIEATTADGAPSGIIVGDRNAAVDPDGFAALTIFSEEGGIQTFDVVVRDLADNESAPTTVEVWTGCAGACASGDPALPTVLVGLALLRRRRPNR